MASLSDTLPPRSVATLAWSDHLKRALAAVTVGAVFGGGWLLGAGMTAPEDLPEREVLAAADARTEQLAKVREQLALSYHNELVGEPRDAEVTREHQRAEAEEKVEQAKAAAAGKAESAGEANLAVPRGAADDGKDADPPAAKEPVDDDDAPAPKPADDEELIATPPEAESAADRTAVARALAKVLGDSEPAVAKLEAEADDKAKADAQPAAIANKRYAVQIASTPSAEGADKLVADLKAAGHKAEKVAVEIEGKGTMFRVRVGGFASRDDASAYQAKLPQAGFIVSE